MVGDPTAQVLPLRWHDPLKLIETNAPSRPSRIVLWSVCVLVSSLLVWASVGTLDIIATADGQLVSQTLLKVVQPAGPGLVKELLVAEGDSVKRGQLLVRLDATAEQAERGGLDDALATALMQARRIQAALQDSPMRTLGSDDPALFAQVQGQDRAQRKAFHDELEQEQSQLVKAEFERKSALQVLGKLEQTLPSYQQAAESYAKLEQDGFVGKLAMADKRREAIERSRDLDAQRAAVGALNATITAQQKKLGQLRSTYRAELERELAEIRVRILQLQPSLKKINYQEGLMELRAPQDGVVKDLATTTVGAVVQAGAVVLTLVPTGEQLFADVAVKNVDVGFVRSGQQVQVKLATYPFQKYGMLQGTVMRISADASDTGKRGSSLNSETDWTPASGLSVYKARVRLAQQTLTDAEGAKLQLAPGMQLTAEIKQGRRTVMEYLLSPVRKTVMEAGRER
jgi:hemolysin D